MENSEKAQVMVYHFKSIGEDIPFVLRANGKFEWIEGHLEPSEETLIQWKQEMETKTIQIDWIREIESEYNKDGCTEKTLIVALWERIVEDRPEASDALEVKRQAVKERIPKP